MDHLIFDIEITTHCNAACTFCPRDSIPFLQHMELATLDRTIARLLELPLKPAITLCGTGDCSTHPRLTEIVGKLTSTFPQFNITTNGQRINEKKTAELLAAGLKTIVFSVSEVGATYDQVYGKPFERVLKNILHFRDVAGDQCKVVIALLTRQHAERKIYDLKNFWAEKGFNNFLVMHLNNRAAALGQHSNRFNQDQDFDQVFASDKSLGPCMIPFSSTLIGPDGTYYLCSQDFKKQRAFGNVFTHTVAESWQEKQKYFQEDRRICAGCTANPLSMLAQKYPDITVSGYKAMLEDVTGKSDLQVWGLNMMSVIREINSMPSGH
jgi:MoaA/NifB/PqqE/SkfB family radical SAM enzyme